MTRCRLNASVAALAVILSLTGCSGDDSVVPLPASAQATVSHQVLIPFPYVDILTDGKETWLVVRDAANRLLLEVTWRNESVASIPIEHQGLNPVAGTTLSLGGEDYDVVGITLHNDWYPYSGYVTLQSSQANGQTQDGK